jgi:hypothetical protein
VLLDADLAKLYKVETKVLIQAVKRNANRFPEDFMFQLTKQEYAHLRSQTVTSSWGGRRHLPFKVVFDAIRELMTPPSPHTKRSIGFTPWEQ